MRASARCAQAGLQGLTRGAPVAPPLGAAAAFLRRLAAALEAALQLASGPAGGPAPGGAPQPPASWAAPAGQPPPQQAPRGGGGGGGGGRRQRVAAVSLVRALPMYGYHPEERPFAKIAL